MNVRQIAYFVAVVEHGGYRAAASALGITQPALSKSISNLEEQLGVTLLTRARGQRAEITTFGRVIYDRGLKVLDEVEDTRRAIELLRKGYVGDIRIGFSLSMGGGMIARIASHIRKQLPSSMILIRSGLQHALLPKLRAGEFDFLILAGLNGKQVDDLSVLPLWSDPFRVFMGVEHPLSSGTMYDRKLANEHKWLSSEMLVASDSRASLFLGHTKHSVKPFEFDVFDPSIVASLLFAGDFLSAWPSKIFGDYEAAGLLTSLTIPAVAGETWSSETSMVSLSGRPASPIVQSARRIVLSTEFGEPPT